MGKESVKSRCSWEEAMVRKRERKTEGFPVCESRCGSPRFTHNKNNPSLRDWIQRERPHSPYRPQIHFNTFSLIVVMLLNKNINRIWFKWTVHPKMKVLWSFIHPHVVPNKYDFLSSKEHNGGLLKYILATLLDFGPFRVAIVWLQKTLNILHKLFGPFHWFTCIIWIFSQKMTFCFSSKKSYKLHKNMRVGK